MVTWSRAHHLPHPYVSLDQHHSIKMMSEDQVKIEKQFIQKEKDKIFKPNPEKECRKEFYQELKETHPELAMAFPELPNRKKR
jgi:type IV secretory pathway VirB4 component